MGVGFAVYSDNNRLDRVSEYINVELIIKIKNKIKTTNIQQNTSKLAELLIYLPPQQNQE